METSLIMPKKKKSIYQIIGGNTLAMLEDEVNKYIKAGYTPCGGLFSYTYDDTGCVFQAMILKEFVLTSKNKNAI